MDWSLQAFSILLLFLTITQLIQYMKIFNVGFFSFFCSLYFFGGGFGISEIECILFKTFYMFKCSSVLATFFRWIFYYRNMIIFKTIFHFILGARERFFLIFLEFFFCCAIYSSGLRVWFVLVREWLSILRRKIKVTV